MPRSEDGVLQLPYANAKPIPFKELKNASRNFRLDSILGEGEFGPVFKGWINDSTLTAAKPGSGMTVAIKKCNHNGMQGFKEWLTQVKYLSRFRHPNLIKLIAYCAEGDNLLLVYEFMPKGSLDYLFRKMSRIYDNWERLVGATLKREEFRELARAPSFSSTSSDSSRRFSFSSPIHNHIPINPEASSSSSIPSYSGESSGESLPKPRSEDGQPNANAMPIRLKELKKATRNFRPDRIFDAGGFGPFFKGWINERTLTAAKPGSGMTVAIKKWRPDSIRMDVLKEWLTEVNYLSRFRHPNLIKLIAYCTEGDNHLLVYEFMPKGSLYNHLLRGDQCLSWSTRMKVAVDTARGLSFLHDAKNKVIHRNLKSSNILLDEHFNAKLSGFDLAKDGPPDDKTHVSTRVMGTYGYAAPEYIATGHLTENCDVYGFGVVLLELLSGRRAIDIFTGKQQLLVDWARSYLSKKKKNVYRAVDPKLEGQYPLEGAVIVSNLALQCVSHNPRSRPRMAEVLATLERL